MEGMYKKKNLKFDKNLGLGRNLRAVERSTARAESRHTRFSLLRCLDDEDFENQPIEKNEEAVSKIPTFGKPKLKAPVSRSEMLKKWKEEKQMKLQQELKSKKPVFKASGFTAPKPPTFPSFAKTINKTPCKLDSRVKISADSRTRFDNKSYAKTIKGTNIQPSFSSKSQASSSNSTKLLNKESGIQSANRKVPATGSSNLKVKQESLIQLPNKTNTTLQKPSYISTKQIKNQMPIKSQIVSKKTSYTTTTKEVQNSKLHSSSAVPKLTESRNLKPPQTLSNGIPRKNQNKIPEPTTNQKEIHSQLTNKSKTALQKPSFVSTTQKKTELNSCRIGKGPEKTATQIKQADIPSKNGMGPKPQSKSISKIGLPIKKKEDSPKISFRCELSHIEPAEDKFVPAKGFLFHPPTDLSFSFLESGISTIFSKLRAERTSTPKRADLKEMEEKAIEKSFNATEESPEIEVFSPRVPLPRDPVNDSIHGFSENLPEIKMKEYVPIDITSDCVEEKKTSLVEQDSLQNSPKQSDVNKFQTSEESCHLAESTKEESCHVEENILNKLETKIQDPILNIPEVSLPVSEKESPVSKEVTTSEFTEPPKSDLLDEEGIFKKPMEFLEREKSTDVTNFLKQELNLEKPKMQDPAKSLPETSLPTFEKKGPLLLREIPSNSTKLQKDLLTEDEVITRLKPFTRSSEIKTRSFRRSEMPPLESINESLENSSLLESPPKPRKKETLRKSTLCKDFTPRRSMRIAKLSEQLDSPECLFDVRPSFYATPPDSRNGACNASNLTYDFDSLHLETPAEEPPVVQQRPFTRNGKVSLLYTPPPRGRVSIMRKSIKGDLMSFSPDA